jgi:hypothetical protein
MADPMQSELVRAAIEGSGIPAVLFRSGYSGYYPLTVGALAETRMMVREEDRQRALEIISTGFRPSPLHQIADEQRWSRSQLFWTLALFFIITFLVVTIFSMVPRI